MDRRVAHYCRRQERVDAIVVQHQPTDVRPHGDADNRRCDRRGRRTCSKGCDSIGGSVALGRTGDDGPRAGVLCPRETTTAGKGLDGSAPERRIRAGEVVAGDHRGRIHGQRLAPRTQCITGQTAETCGKTHDESLEGVIAWGPTLGRRDSGDDEGDVLDERCVDRCGQRDQEVVGEVGIGVLIDGVDVAERHEHF